MKFFVDTADVAEIKELAATGLLDGVTTNPSLVAKAGRDFKKIIKEMIVGSYLMLAGVALLIALALGTLWWLLG